MTSRTRILLQSFAVCVALAAGAGLGVPSTAHAEKCNPANPDTCVGGPTGGGTNQCGKKDKPCCEDYDGNKSCSAGLSCYDGSTCQDFWEHWNVCKDYDDQAMSFGGAEPWGCFSNPVCTGIYYAYQGNSCGKHDQPGCWVIKGQTTSDGVTSPFVWWAGGACD